MVREPRRPDRPYAGLLNPQLEQLPEADARKVRRAGFDRHGRGGAREPEKEVEHLFDVQGGRSEETEAPAAVKASTAASSTSPTSVSTRALGSSIHAPMRRSPNAAARGAGNSSRQPTASSAFGPGQHIEEE